MSRPRYEPFHLVEATIADIRKALDNEVITSVELVVMYLNRIARYDRSGPRLNSTPVLNPAVLEEAAEADRTRWRADRGLLHGIPFTVKDSFKVKGLTVAAGSPAFAALIADEDAACVEALRRAGAIVLGKTNMPPMAIGGVQRGLYGRAESPYNPDYLPAAWHSGSSSGSGVAVAASLCAFGLGEETVSSGRSPASNNGLVAYTPSRGLLSIRGNWPLFALRDTVVPHTRTVADMLVVLDALMVPDARTEGDLWREQTAVNLPTVAEIRPSRFADLAEPGALKGLRIGVPRMYVGADTEAHEPIVVRPSIQALWAEAAATLEALGATLVPVDLPAVSHYEKDRPGTENLVERGLVPADWNAIEIGDMVAASWDAFLRGIGDPNYPGLGAIRPEVIHADPPDAVDTRRRKSAHPGRDEFNYPAIVERARAGIAAPLEAFPQLPDVMRGLEQARVTLFEDWMRANELDLVAFPANADISTSNADVDQRASDLAWCNGTVFSNMNHVMRHLGIPSVTVTMGVMQDTGIPVGLTFAGPAYADTRLLRAAFDYEGASRKRNEPPATPETESDRRGTPRERRDKFETTSLLTVTAQYGGRLHRSGGATVEVHARAEGGAGRVELSVHIDGQPVQHEGGNVLVALPASARRPGRFASMITVLAKDELGQTAATYAIVDYDT